METGKILITGASGYMGRRLARLLLDKGYAVRALVRKGSEDKIPAGAEIFLGNVLDASTYSAAFEGISMVIHLVGVSHPSPKKKELFRTIDLESVKQLLKAAAGSKLKQLIYVSVAQTPSGIMKEYQHARAEAEEAIRQSGIPHTFIRPWYVAGPGHYWPLFLLPAYALLKLIPATREKAMAFDLVYLPQMMRAFLDAVKHEPVAERCYEVADIRRI